MRKSHADELDALRAAHAAAVSEADERGAGELKRVQMELDASQNDFKKLKETVSQLQARRRREGLAHPIARG